MFIFIDPSLLVIYTIFDPVHETLQLIVADQNIGDLIVEDFPGLIVTVSVISSANNLISPKSPEHV